MEYTGIVGAGFFFFSLSMCASNLIRSEGNTKASMVGMLIGALLNTILDPLFIFGFGMGVKGAAIATVISQIASCIYLFGMYARKKTVVSIRRSYLRLDMGILGKSIALGIPSFIQSAGMSILMLLVNTSLGNYGGDEAITTYGMVHKLLMIVIMPISGHRPGISAHRRLQLRREAVRQGKDQSLDGRPYGLLDRAFRLRLHDAFPAAQHGLFHQRRGSHRVKLPRPPDCRLLRSLRGDPDHRLRLFPVRGEGYRSPRAEPFPTIPSLDPLCPHPAAFFRTERHMDSLPPRPIFFRRR